MASASNEPLLPMSSARASGPARAAAVLFWGAIPGALSQEPAPETLVGRPLPELELASPAEPERRVPLASWAGGEPLVLVLGSSTSPSLAPAAPGLSELARVYAGEARFVWIYLREAQALERPDPATLAERAARCREAQAELGLTFPALVDDLDDRAGRAFDAYPEGSFVIAADGRVAFDGGAVLDPDALELALLAELTSATPAPEAPTPAARHPAAGLLDALDADGDGALSPAEIDGASAVLRAFDLDGDGFRCPTSCAAPPPARAPRPRPPTLPSRPLRTKAPRRRRSRPRTSPDPLRRTAPIARWRASTTTATAVSRASRSRARCSSAGTPTTETATATSTRTSKRRSASGASAADTSRRRRW
jgi:hypothetical protein